MSYRVDRMTANMAGRFLIILIFLFSILLILLVIEQCKFQI